MRRLVAIALVLAGCRGSSERVTVAFATGARAVAPDLERAFEAEHGGDVVLLLGGSGALADQVVTGSEIDVLVLADRAEIDRLAERGQVDPDSRAPVAATRLALVAARPAPRVTFETLTELPANQSIAIGNPEHSAAGVHTRALFRRLGIWDTLRPRMVLAGDVAAALAAVRRGQAEAAVVYEPDARGVQGMDLLDTAEPPPQPELWAGLTRRGAGRDAARAFASFLRSGTARRLFAEHGFLPPVTSRRE
ncbi:MAG TPA: molybdate ABC transporter substrate-binding protein [Kofleriaceae bacterium]|nr:molybdate ABC transporter substrate-binding protein [Kofleriaceae bacterium]